MAPVGGVALARLVRSPIVEPVGDEIAIVASAATAVELPSTEAECTVVALRAAAGDGATAEPPPNALLAPEAPEAVRAMLQRLTVACAAIAGADAARIATLRIAVGPEVLDLTPPQRALWVAPRARADADAARCLLVEEAALRAVFADLRAPRALGDVRVELRSTFGCRVVDEDHGVYAAERRTGALRTRQTTDDHLAGMALRAQPNARARRVVPECDWEGWHALPLRPKHADDA